MGKTREEKMEMLEARKAGLESKIVALRQQAAQAARRDDSRRKLLIGAAMLAAVEAGKVLPETVSRMLDQFLTRPSDRAVFLVGRFQISAAAPTAKSEGGE